MNLFLFVLLAIIFRDIRYSSGNEFVKGYIEPANCRPVKGFFTLFILLSHYVLYAYPTGHNDQIFLALRKWICQGTVAMFLFYSGFGIMKKIQSDGAAYVKKLARVRFPQLFISFEISVCLYWALQTFLGKRYRPMTLLHAFIGWGWLGNSSWYVFVTLVLYLLLIVTFLPMFIRSDKLRKVYPYIGAALFTAEVAVFMLWLRDMGKRPEWFNSMLVFPAGVWYALFHKKIEKIVMHSLTTWLASMAACIALLAWAYHNRGPYSPCHLKAYTLYILLYTAFVLLLTMKVSIDSPMLNWFGDHVFSVYILQRLPMIFLSERGYMENYFYSGLIVTILVTMLMAHYFDQFRNWLFKINWKNLFRKGNKT